MAGSHETKQAGRPNTIGLNERLLDDLLDILDAGEAEANKRREYARWPFRMQSVSLKIEHPGGSSAEFTVAARNLSAGGMSLLHSSFVFPGSSCTVELPHPRRGVVPIKATIARCSHIRGIVHEIGLVFGEQINVREFIASEELDECFSIEKIDPEQLEGRLLLISPSELDHRIIKHFLRETLMRVSTASNAEEALQQAREGCDIILVELHMDEVSGAELVPMLRDAGIQTPTILMSSDTSPRARVQVRNAQADAFLAKPLTDESLMRGLAEFLVMDRERDEGSGDAIAGAAGLAQSFTKELTRQADQLEQAIAEKNIERCQALALELKGTAPCLGFDKIGKAASAAAEALTSTHSVELSKIALDDLVMTCRRSAPG